MKFFYFLIITFLFCLNSIASERQIQCKVVGISDGDTFTCLVNRTQIKVRLVHIDAPELAQPYGNKAKQALANLIFKKYVILKIVVYDRYQRLLAEVYNDKGENINLKLVQQGMAWAYTRSSKQYEQAQKQAQRAKIGLWRDTFPTHPSEWRKHNEVSSIQAVKNRESFANLSQNINCQRKLSCQQISNYELALRYFRQCGWKELDGNNDGIPCNKLYRKAIHNRK